MILELCHRNQNSNAVIHHEGKTPGSIFCGSAGMYPCLRREENPGGRTGYPENHWDSFFVSPKCGKRMDLTGFLNSSPRGLNLK
jgi:hypothetical protein